MKRRGIISLSAITTLGLALLPGSAVSQQQSLNEQLVGLWALTSHSQKVSATGAMKHPFGEYPSGYQMFTKGGHMMFLLIGENRKGPAGAALTDVERAALFNSLVAQSGTYKLEGTKVLIHYDGSATPSLTGADRAYSAEISGNKLTLTASSSFTTEYNSGQTGEQIITIRTFERVE
jgi:hypothetical protein